MTKPYVIDMPALAPTPAPGMSRHKNGRVAGIRRLREVWRPASRASASAWTRSRAWLSWLWRCMVAFLALAFLAASGARAEMLSHEFSSLHQAGPTLLRVLLPSRMEPGRSYSLVLVLPVAHAGDKQEMDRQYGDGLAEVQRLGLHDQYEAIFASPGFTDVPWYCNHPSKAEVAQEQYLFEVLAEIDRKYPVSKRPGDRHLLGFSKSGWGAWALLLRHPHQFGRAAAWDSPLMMTAIGKWDTGRVCGSQSAFEAYLPSKLVQSRAQALGSEPRLILLGYDAFRDDHQRMHSLLSDLGVPHVYRDGPYRGHAWRTGWLPEAVAYLFGR